MTFGAEAVAEEILDPEGSSGITIKVKQLLAPAKVNLSLGILGKRPDGYHQIETIFERISIFDVISVDISPANIITCDSKDVPTGEGSLLMNVVKSFQEKLKEKSGNRENANFAVNLQKNIPIGAGLGGGSSDAATLLLGLNDITGKPLTMPDMLDIANSLGSDISFFLHDTPFAVGSGRGEVIKKLESRVKLCHIVINPPFKIYTKGVYEKYAANNNVMYNSDSPLTLTKKSSIDKMVTSFLEDKKGAYIPENLFNDLEYLVLKSYPLLDKIFSELEKAGAKGTLLSGSGPTVFGIFDPGGVKSSFDKLREIFPENNGWKNFIAWTY